MDDPTLVAALVAGDPRGLEGAYRTYADRLHTYCRGMLRDPEAAADAVHDTFVLASQRAGQLRDPERLRSWLYAIARNECLRMLRGTSRQAPLEEAGQVSAPEVDPVAGVRAAEIQELVWSAAAGLSPGDREVFELAIRHELPAQEVSELLGVSVAHAHARLSRARAQLERSLGALLVARTGQQDCPQLAELLSGWDGQLTALVRKRISRHIESCATCSEQQRRQLTPAALFAAYAGLPFLAVPAELWPRLELTCFDPGQAGVREAVLDRAGRFEAGSGFPRPLDLRRQHRVRVAAVAAVAVAALLAGGFGAMIGPPAVPVADEPNPLPPTAAAVASPTGLPLGNPTASPIATPLATPTPESTPGPPSSPGPLPLPPVPTTSPPPPANTPPPIGEVTAVPDTIRLDDRRCATVAPNTRTASVIRAVVTDAEDPPDALQVRFRYELSRGPPVTGAVTMSLDRSGSFAGLLGPFPFDEGITGDGGRFTVTVSATDSDGGTTTADPVFVGLVPCNPAG